MRRPALLATLAGCMASAAPAAPVDVIVTVENLAPAGGTWLSAGWVGFHDGGFDWWDEGAPAPEALEPLAELADPSVIASRLEAAQPDGLQGRVFGARPPFDDLAPGDAAQARFTVDPEAGRYMSYAWMFLPSNDAFQANDDPLAIDLFGEDGSFDPTEVVLTGADVFDAGTEVNDEAPDTTALLGFFEGVPMRTPLIDGGEDEGGVARPHPGYAGSATSDLPPIGPPGGILSNPAFAAADFLAPDYGPRVAHPRGARTPRTRAQPCLGGAPGRRAPRGRGRLPPLAPQLRSPNRRDDHAPIAALPRAPRSGPGLGGGAVRHPAPRRQPGAGGDRPRVRRRARLGRPAPPRQRRAGRCALRGDRGGRAAAAREPHAVGQRPQLGPFGRAHLGRARQRRAHPAGAQRDRGDARGALRGPPAQQPQRRRRALGRDGLLHRPALRPGTPLRPRRARARARLRRRLPGGPPPRAR